MTNNERTALLHALDSLDCVVVDDCMYARHQLSTLSSHIDLYNYRAIGKMVLGKRMLAEILGIPHQYLLSGEYWEETDDITDLCRFCTPSSIDAPLTESEKNWLIQTVLIVLNGIGGVNDGDDACVRVATRIIAEVAGYPDLDRYRLLMEREVKPLYFQEYIPQA